MVGVSMVCAVVLAAAPMQAQERYGALDEEPPGVATQLGLGMASVGINLGYMPAKMLYALGGGLVGLLAWGVTAGNTDVAKGIFSPSFGGSWAVTPRMLHGDEPIMFNGPTYDARR
jgi:hypothetical protein